MKAEQLRKILLFGFCVESNFPFSLPLPACSNPSEMTIQVVPAPPAGLDNSKVEPLYHSPSQQSTDQARLLYYRLGDWHLLRFPNAADFFLSRNTILIYPQKTVSPSILEVYLLGTVFSFWLETQAILALHASAVIVQGGVIGFLSGNRGGKTSLAAAMLQAGYPLQSDDILPVESTSTGFMARPAYPAMRMWPEEIQHFMGKPAENFASIIPGITKRRVSVGEYGWGSFSNASYPPTIFYIPERLQSNDPAILSLSLTPREAAVELLRYSFTPNLVNAAGLSALRLDQITRLATSVPVRRLIYPNDYMNLPGVCQFILRDLAKSL